MIGAAVFEEDEKAAAWDRMEGEPVLWYGRFDMFFKLQGSERTLLGAYRLWYQREKARESAAITAPSSWRHAAASWSWRERAAAWDGRERELRHRREEKDRAEARRRRIVSLNGLMTKAQTAILNLDPEAAKWGDVTAAVRVVVQELRHEYEGDVKKVRVEQAQSGAVSMSDLAKMTDEELAAVIENFLLLQPIGDNNNAE